MAGDERYRAARWDAPQGRIFEVPEVAAVLTHLGRRKADGSVVFIEEPLWRVGPGERWVEVDVSTFEGRLTISDAARLRRRRPQNSREKRQDCVRYFLVGDLLNAGYMVLRTPTDGIPNHVSIYANLLMVAEHTGDDHGVVMVNLAGNRWWWALPGRVTLEELEVERRFADAQ